MIAILGKPVKYPALSTDGKHIKREYVPTTEGYMSKEDLAKRLHMSRSNLVLKAYRFGWTHPKVTEKPQKGGWTDAARKRAYQHREESSQIKLKPTPRWDRKLCSRGYEQCINYNACQSSRCHLAGSEPWDNRQSTDHCFTAPPSLQTLVALNYPSQLGISA
jgi:hypothetical protein